MQEVTFLYSFDLPNGSQAIASTSVPEDAAEFFQRIKTSVIRWRFGLERGHHSLTIDARVSMSDDGYRVLLEEFCRRWNADPDCKALRDTHVEIMFTCRGHGWIGASTAMLPAEKRGPQGFMQLVDYPAQMIDLAREREAREASWRR